MFGIGFPELVLILIVGLIVFGPSKLPEMARTLGKGVREFRRATSALQQAINEPDQVVKTQVKKTVQKPVEKTLDPEPKPEEKAEPVPKEEAPKAEAPKDKTA